MCLSIIILRDLTPTPSRNGLPSYTSLVYEWSTSLPACQVASNVRELLPPIFRSLNFFKLLTILTYFYLLLKKYMYYLNRSYGTGVLLNPTSTFNNFMSTLRTSLENVITVKSCFLMKLFLLCKLFLDLDTIASVTLLQSTWFWDPSVALF